jgi:uncharacterized protein YecE (DUF72 family)
VNKESIIYSVKKVYVGTSGYNYKEWRGKFYPEDLPQREWLSFYAQHFSTVEIDATFYRSFPRHIYTKWAGLTTNNFIFSIKGSRYITHRSRLNIDRESVDMFFDSTAGLGDKFGPALWQFPPLFKNTEENKNRLKNFLDMLPNESKNAFEFRDESWFVDEIYELLNAYNAGFVINDSGKIPSREVVTGSFVYIRFHGPGALYASEYSREQLGKWSKKIKKYQKNYDVFAYFNNDVKAYAPKNAQELRELLL